MTPAPSAGSTAPTPVIPFPAADPLAGQLLSLIEQALKDYWNGNDGLFLTDAAGNETLHRVEYIYSDYALYIGLIDVPGWFTLKIEHILPD